MVSGALKKTLELAHDEANQEHVWVWVLSDVEMADWAVRHAMKSSASLTR